MLSKMMIYEIEVVRMQLYLKRIIGLQKGEEFTVTINFQELSLEVVLIIILNIANMGGCFGRSAQNEKRESKLDQLMRKLQREIYPSNQSKVKQLNQVIQKQIQEGQSFMSKLKEGNKTLYVKYFYQKARLFYYQSEYSKALNCIIQLQRYSRQIQKKKKISVIPALNISIFRFLIEACHLYRYIDTQTFNYFKEKYQQLIGLIMEEKLNEVQKSEMLVFVSSLYYHYASAKWELSKSQMNSSMNKQIVLELDYLGNFVSRYGLQLIINSQDRTVKKIQLISLQADWLNKRDGQKFQCRKQEKTYLQFGNVQVNCKKEFNIVSKGDEQIIIQSNGRKLTDFELQNAQDKQYLVESLLFNRIEKQQISNKQKTNCYYFINLAAVYITKTNSGCSQGLCSRWLKLYQQRQFCLANKKQWNFFQGNSQAIVIVKQMNCRPSAKLDSSIIQQLCSKFALKKQQPRKEQIKKTSKKTHPQTEKSSKQPVSSDTYKKYDNSSSSSQQSNTKSNQEERQLLNSPQTQKKSHRKVENGRSDSMVQNLLPSQPSTQRGERDVMKQQKIEKIELAPSIRQVKVNNIPVMNRAQVIQRQKQGGRIQSDGKSGAKQYYEQITTYIKNNKKSNEQNSKQLEYSTPTTYLTIQQQKEKEKENKFYKQNKTKYDRGLQNIGNTCYMNSALQCLHKSRYFTQCFQQSTIFNRKGKLELTKLFKQFVEQMWLRSTPFDPSQIKKVMGQKNYLFKHNNQSDATQFFLTFLSIISEELNDPTDQSQKEINHYFESDRTIYEKIKFNDETYCRSIVESIFTGRYKVEYNSTLKSCEHKYVLFEKFNVHYLDIPSTNRSSVKLQDCLQHSKRPDELRPSDRMTCDICHKSTFDIKNMEIYEVSKVLVLSFRRFLNGRKNEVQIKVPQFLQPSDVILKSELANYQGKNFRLYGAIIHYGNLKGGHYVAVCYSYYSKKWMKYDDSRVSETQHNFEVGQAMTLFYELSSMNNQSIEKNLSKNISQPGLNRISQLPTQNRSVYSLICCVLNWLVRCKPFRHQFLLRFNRLQCNQSQIKNNLLMLQQMISNKCIDDNFLKAMQRRREQVFKDASYKPYLSQLQNFINSFLFMLNQMFIESNGPIKSKGRFGSNQKEQQLLNKDMDAELISTNLIKTYSFKCPHKIDEPSSQNFAHFAFTGSLKSDRQLISRFFSSYSTRAYQPDSARMCSKCQIKQYKIYYQLVRTNKLLLIELQRFTGSSKNENIVNVPLELQISKDIREYRDQFYRNKVYRLSAVITHQGSVSAGLYQADIYDFETRRWLHCENSQTSDIGYSPPKFENAYSLIYELVGKDYKK